MLFHYMERSEHMSTDIWPTRRGTRFTRGCVGQLRLVALLLTMAGCSSSASGLASSLKDVAAEDARSLCTRYDRLRIDESVALQTLGNLDAVARQYDELAGQAKGSRAHKFGTALSEIAVLLRDQRREFESSARAPMNTPNSVSTDAAETSAVNPDAIARTRRVVSLHAGLDDACIGEGIVQSGLVR